MNHSLASRFNLIKSQLMPGRILDEAVIHAIYDTERERFVPDTYKGSAYVDKDIPIGNGRFLMEPLTFTHLLGLAEISKADIVLDVGCGTGYSCVILSKLCKMVVGLEEYSDLALQAKQNMTDTGCTNVEIVSSFSDACKTNAIYQVIFFEGSIQNLPDAVTSLLAEGGKIVAIENIALRPNDQTGLGRAAVWTKTGGKLTKRLFFDASVPLLPGFEKKKDFVF